MADTIKQLGVSSATYLEVEQGASKTLYTTDANTTAIIKSIRLKTSAGIDSVFTGNAEIKLNGFNIGSVSSFDDVVMTGLEVMPPSSSVTLNLSNSNFDAAYDRYRYFGGTGTTDNFQLKEVNADLNSVLARSVEYTSARAMTGAYGWAKIYDGRPDGVRLILWYSTNGNSSKVFSIQSVDSSGAATEHFYQSMSYEGAAYSPGSQYAWVANAGNLQKIDLNQPLGTFSTTTVQGTGTWSNSSYPKIESYYDGTDEYVVAYGGNATGLVRIWDREAATETSAGVGSLLVNNNIYGYNGYIRASDGFLIVTNSVIENGTTQLYNYVTQYFTVNPASPAFVNKTIIFSGTWPDTTTSIYGGWYFLSTGKCFTQTTNSNWMFDFTEDGTNLTINLNSGVSLGANENVSESSNKRGMSYDYSAMNNSTDTIDVLMTGIESV